MDQLSKIKDSVFGFFTPTRNTMPDPKRRRTTGPDTSSKGLAGEHAYAPNSEPRGAKAQVALYSKLSTKYSSTSISKKKNPLKRSREDDDLDHDEDEQLGSGEAADTEMKSDEEEEDDGSVRPEDSPSQISALDDEEVEEGGEEGEADGEDGEEVEDDEEENGEIVEYDDEEEVEEPVDEEAAARQKVEEYLARQAELALKMDAIAEIKRQGTWHPDEIYLFERLSLRSFEPLIPQEWQIDFATLPEDIFAQNKDTVLVNYNCTPSTNGVRALQRLLALGTLFEDGPPLRRIEIDLRNYIKWTERDGGYFKKRTLQVLTVVIGKPNHSTDRISKNITDQMQFAAKQHRDYLLLPEPRVNEVDEVELYWRQPPLLYGIIVAQTIAILVTLDSSNPEAKLRHIAHFDFKEKKMAVWNGFALAIICCVARNYIMTIKDELEDESSEEDIDA